MQTGRCVRVGNAEGYPKCREAIRTPHTDEKLVLQIVVQRYYKTRWSQTCSSVPLYPKCRKDMRTPDTERQSIPSIQEGKLVTPQIQSGNLPMPSDEEHKNVVRARF